jgi:hypothetical protein
MVGERFAVVNIEDCEALPEWLETLGGVPIAREAYAMLKAPGGDGNEPAGCERMRSKEKRLACAKRFVLFSDLVCLCLVIVVGVAPAAGDGAHRPQARPGSLRHHLSGAAPGRPVGQRCQQAAGSGNVITH